MPQYARLCGTGTSVLVHVVSLHCHLVTRAYLFMYLPCFIAATWWRRHGFFVLAVSRSTREVHGRPCFYVRCVSALPPGGMGMPGCLPSVSQGHHLVIRAFFVCAPAMSHHGNACLQAGHVQLCHAAVAVFYSNATYCATIWACLFAYSQVMPHGYAGRQCGRIYSCAYCVPVMPLGGLSVPDCMPSLFKQLHMAERAHPLHTCMS